MNRHYLSLWAVRSLNKLESKLSLYQPLVADLWAHLLGETSKGAFKNLSRSLSLSLFSSGTYSLRTSPLAAGPICHAVKPVAL